MPQPQQLLPNLTFLDLRPPVADAAREVAACEEGHACERRHADVAVLYIDW